MPRIVFDVDQILFLEIFRGAVSSDFSGSASSVLILWFCIVLELSQLITWLVGWLDWSTANKYPRLIPVWCGNYAKALSLSNLMDIYSAITDYRLPLNWLDALEIFNFLFLPTTFKPFLKSQCMLFTKPIELI